MMVDRKYLELLQGRNFCLEIPEFFIIYITISLLSLLLFPWPKILNNLDVQLILESFPSLSILKNLKNEIYCRFFVYGLGWVQIFLGKKKGLR